MEPPKPPPRPVRPEGDEGGGRKLEPPPKPKRPERLGSSRENAPEVPPLPQTRPQRDAVGTPPKPQRPQKVGTSTSISKEANEEAMALPLPPRPKKNEEELPENPPRPPRPSRTKFLFQEGYQAHGLMEVMDARIVPDVQLLKGLTPDQLGYVVENALMFLQKPDTATFIKSMEMVVEESGINQRILKTSLRGLFLVLKGAQANGLGAKEVGDDFTRMGFAGDLVDAIKLQWGRQYSSLVHSYLERNMIRTNRLVDMDWQFGFTTGTDEVNEIDDDSGFLQLRFHIDKGDGEISLESIELSLIDFYQLLDKLENL